MYVKLKSNILYRKYPNFGYLTDNRFYEYKSLNNHNEDIGDIIVSESGSDLISVLSRSPKPIEAIVDDLMKIYDGCSFNELKKIAIEFYQDLALKGFLSIGESKSECNDSNQKLENIKNQNSNQEANNKSVIDFFKTYLNGRNKLNSIHIEISSKCNEKCIHCFIPEEFKTSIMNLEIFNKILLQAKKLNVLHITISGGEPMTNINFIQYLKMCREMDFSVSVLSNLNLLSDEMIDEMKKNPLLGVQTSLYSIDSKIHDAITRLPGSCNKTMKSIEKLLNANIPVQISCPIIKQNKNCFIDVVAWANKRNISVLKEYAIIAEYNHNVENIQNRLSIEEISQVFDIENLYNSNFYDILRQEANKKKKYHCTDSVCSVCYDSIGFLPNGNAFPCPGWENYILGNIQTNTLEEIWYDLPKINELRNVKRNNLTKCLKCPDKKYCSPCLLRNANESQNGNMFEIQPFFCQYAKLKHNKIEEYENDKARMD